MLLEVFMTINRNDFFGLCQGLKEMNLIFVNRWNLQIWSEKIENEVQDKRNI